MTKIPETELGLPPIFTLFASIQEADLSNSELEQLIGMINGYRYSKMNLSDLMRIIRS